MSHHIQQDIKACLFEALRENAAIYPEQLFAGEVMLALPPPHKNSSKVAHIKHLMAQREHLLVLRDYLAWMSNAKNAEITLTYQNLVDLLEQTAIEYDVLVNMLQKQVNQNRDTAK